MTRQLGEELYGVEYSFPLGQGMRIFVSDVNAQKKALRYSGCLIIRWRDWPFLRHQSSSSANTQGKDPVNKMATIILKMQANSKLSDRDFLSLRPFCHQLSL